MAIYSHFRPKNASINLKVGHILYLGGFYDQYEQNWSKIEVKKQKNFGGNPYSSFNFHQNGPIFFICDLWDTFRRSFFYLFCSEFTPILLQICSYFAPICSDFAENFRSHRNHLNTIYGKFLGQLKHFWA